MKEAGKPAAPDRGVRLQAFLASRGVASRRACEEIIRAGRVSVDGYTAEGLGQRVTLGAKVLVDGQPVGSEARKRYLALHKPKGILSSMSDPHGRPVAVDLLRPEVQERVYNVGRLDYDSSGLLLFTNDGEFARIVGHPSGNVEKEYRVRTGG
ncbi:MAG TPA: pseudouridine synthase, partial [Magnetospirillaceae bacterium]|nr:pseudouridine synthase [Magnetospirillaceae bacterium]